MKDPVQTDTYEAVLFNQQDLGEHLQDQTLYKAYQQTDRQTKNGLNPNLCRRPNDEGNSRPKLGETRQNISNIHKKALNKLKEETGGDVRERRKNDQWGNGRTH
nr:hypothetical protein [Bacillus pumilus]